MKKFTNVLMLAAVAATALVSCAKELDAPKVTVQKGISIAVITGDIESKTEISGTNKVVWKSTDKVGFFNGEADVNVESSAAVIDGDGKATFTATVPSSGTYYAYYPYQADGSYSPDAEGVTVRIKNTQTPTPTTFDPLADLLVSDGFSATGETDTPATIRFKRLAAIIRIQYQDGTTGSVLSGEYATESTIQGENFLCGRFKISASGLIDKNSGYKKITATYPTNTYALTTAGNYSFFGVRPQTLAKDSELILTINTGRFSIEKTIVMPKDVVLGAGDLLPIKVTITDADLVTSVTKVWTKLSESSLNWMAGLTDGVHSGSAGTDNNIAVDRNYVYVPELSTTKYLWAISTDETPTVKLVNTTTVESKGYDGGNYLSCARVVKKSDGTPVLIATNLFSDDASVPGRMYVWDNGIDAAPKVVTMNGWSSGRRLGDTFTTYGNFEDCWLICGTQTGNGFVTFQVPTGSTSYLTSRLAVDLTNFASYYPFPGEITKGMFSWRGGTHDDGGIYRNRKMTVDSTEEAIKTSGAHTSTISKLNTWMPNSENNNGTGFNFFEFRGKRFVAWCMNSTDTKTFDLIIKCGSKDTDWETIIDTAGTFFRETITGEVATGWKNAADCAVWADADVVYIAIQKQNVGCVLYKME